MSTGLPDCDLVKLAQSGDSSAREELCRRFLKTAEKWYWIRGVAGNEEDFQDVLQEAALTIMLSLQALKDASKFWSWARTITLNWARVRRKANSRALHEREASKTKDAIELGTERQDEVAKALDALKPSGRDLVRLLFEKGLSVKEIAALDPTQVRRRRRKNSKCRSS